MDATLTPVLDQAGHLTGYLAVGRDITQELMLQEQLQQSQKMEAIGTLAGGIAHDFNNVLSAIFGYTDLARHHLADDERLEQYLEQIMSSAKRARNLVSRILTFSRKADMGRAPLIPKDIITDTVKLLRASLPSTIEIKESLKSDAAVIGNATQIHQMTMNLCTNAGYEMRETGGTLEITLDETHAGADMRLQYPVEAFNSSPSVWKAFSADPDAFDIIATDYAMTQMTGPAFSEKVRQTGSSIPIVLCSGYLELKEKLSPLQPIEFVKKPITANELALAIGRVMDRSGKHG